MDLNSAFRLSTILAERNHGKKYDDSGEEEVLEEACAESELPLGSPIDEDQEQTEFEDVFDRLQICVGGGF